MASDVYLSSDGKLINDNESKYIWISDIFNGLGIPSSSEQCSIEFPLSSDPLRCLMSSLLVHMQHNFMPAVLTILSVNTCTTL